MDIVYKKWESGQGLEEIQATIYTEVSGLPAQTEQIGPRNDTRGTDMTRYALTKDGKPLAYVTSSKSTSTPGRYNIGYPWSMPNCPEEAKMKIFKEQFSHLKKQDDMETIITAVVLSSKIADKQIEFFEEQGFTETSRIVRFTNDYESKELSKMEISDKAKKLSSRLATDEDVDLLIELVKADPNISRAFPNDEAARRYFEDRVLKDGHAVIVFDGDTPVASSALLKYEPDGFFVTADSTRIVPRFVAVRSKYRYAWDRLLVELAKEAVSAGWTDIPLRIAFGSEVDEPQVITMAKTNPNIDAFEAILTYQQE